MSDSTSGDDIFKPQTSNTYHEPAAPTDFAAFKVVVESRRSIRQYEQTEIPEATVKECLRLALLAPTSSNLQCWEFYWIRTPELKKKIAEYCFSQPAATTAPVLIVAVARTKTWKRNAKQLVEHIDRTKGPRNLRAYYTKLVPHVYGWFGPFGILSPIKWLLFNLVGLFKVVPRDPVSLWGLQIWAHKTVALACENLMLAFRAAGYDSCPMEGFDACRVHKALKLPCDAKITMIVSAGKRKVGGVYGPQVRLPQDQFVFER